MVSRESMNPHVASKERIIFNALEGKIAATRNTLNRALAMKGENIGAQLDNLWVETLNNAPESKDRFIEAKRLRVEGNKIAITIQNEEDRFRSLDDEEDPDTDDEDEDVDEEREEHDKEMEMLLEREAEITKKLETLTLSDKNHSIEFLTNIELLIKNLKRKQMQVKVISTPIEQVSNRAALVLKKTRNIRLKPDDITEVRMDNPFTLVLLIKPESFERMRGKTNRGVFFGGTPLCLIKAGIKGEEGTIAHERLHALTEGVVRTENPTKTLLENIHRIARVLELSKKGENLAQSMSSFQVRSMLNKLHGEIVAAAEQAIDVDFWRGDSSGKVSIEEKLLRALGLDQPDFELDRFVSAFKTAGVQTADVLAMIDLQRDKYKDSPEMLGLIDKIAEDFQKEFLIMARGVEQAARIIDTVPIEMQPDAREELVTLLCFLPPTKFRHAPDYMRAWSNARKNRQ